MAGLDPRIILAGQAPNVLGALSEGTRAAAMANQVQHQNALSQIYQQHGAGIASGDQNALNALAGMDPMAALDVQRSRLGMDATRQTMDMQRQENARADQRMDILTAQERRAVEQHAASMSAAERAADAQALEEAMKIGLGLPDAAAWDKFMGNNPDTQRLVGGFNYRRALAQKFMTVSEILKGQEPPAPYSDEAKRVADQRNGYLDPNAPPQPNSEAERELARLASIGIPRDVGIKIKEGVYRTITDPITRETLVVDLSTGQPVYRVDMTGQQQSPAPQQPPARMQQNSPAQPGNAGDAFGVEGFAKGVANRAADVVGLPVPYGDVQDVQSDFNVLRESLLNDMAAAYDRQPPSWLLQEIRKLTPAAGSLSDGAEGAQAKLRAIRRNFQNELTIAERQLSRRRSPTQQQDAEAKVAGLEAAIDRLDSALSRFGSGVSAEDDALIRKYLDQ